MNGPGPEKLAELMRLLAGAGHEMTECPVLVPAETVLDLVGPLTRGRLYLTTGIGGREYCLRPEFTIAIAEAHIRSGVPTRQAAYGYCGPVFRKRPTGTGEFLQAGAESIGYTDAIAADADMVVLAGQACRIFGLQTRTTFGDQAIFKAVLTALDLPAVWRRRLLAAFGDRRRLEASLADLEAGDNGVRNRFAGLAGLDPPQAASIVEEMIGVSGSGTIAGRRVEDIGGRLVEKARLSELADRLPGKAATIREYLEIDCPAADAQDRIAQFASKHGMDLGEETGAFAHRYAEIQTRSETLEAVRFQASFGRPLDYYTGFIFDVFDARHDHPGPVCGGGRYDGLAKRLGAANPVPAVGFSLWLDRLLAKDKS